MSSDCFFLFLDFDIECSETVLVLVCCSLAESVKKTCKEIETAQPLAT